MSKDLRTFVQSILLESFGSIIPPPPKDTKEELHYVINQYYNRYNPENVQELCDTGMEHLFNSVIQNAGYSCDIQKIKKLKTSDVHNQIDVLKRTFRRARPYHYAQKLGIAWRGDGYEMNTDDTYSYPSGHACQAYYIAHCLSEEYPELTDLLMHVGEMVSQSRIDRGVHFPSDCRAGQLLAKKIYEKQK